MVFRPRRSLLMASVLSAVLALAALIFMYLSMALNGIFRVAVYQYAVDGEHPSGFDTELLRTAVRGN